MISSKEFRLLCEMGFNTIQHSSFICGVVFVLDTTRKLESKTLQIMSSNVTIEYKLIQIKSLIFEVYRIETTVQLNKKLTEATPIDKDDYSLNILNRYYNSPEHIRDVMFKFLSNRMSIGKEQAFFKQLYLELIGEFGEGTVE